jgi:hypothetical protein
VDLVAKFTKLLGQLIFLLSSSDPEVRLAVKMIFYCVLLVGYFTIYFLIPLLILSRVQVREHACFAFLDLAGHPASKDVLFETLGGVTTVLRLAAIPSPDVKLKALHVISSCAQDAKFR